MLSSVGELSYRLLESELSSWGSDDSTSVSTHVADSEDIIRESGLRKLLEEPQVTSAIDHQTRLIINKLPISIIQRIFSLLNQFDLVNVLRTCSAFYTFATEKLYSEINVLFDCDVALQLLGNWPRYIREHGDVYLDTTFITTIAKLVGFMKSLHTNPLLIQKLHSFSFDKCYEGKISNIYRVQKLLSRFLSSNCRELKLLHITFRQSPQDLHDLSKTALHHNVRNKITKLFLMDSQDLYSPAVPQNLSNLYLLLDEDELVGENPLFDLSTERNAFLNNLSVFICNTMNKLGFVLLDNVKPMEKMRLNGFRIDHSHVEDTTNFAVKSKVARELVEKVDKRLRFQLLSSKLNLTTLTFLILRVDCIEDSLHMCNCFEKFFEDFTVYSTKHGLPNLKSFKFELNPSPDWMRPNQILKRLLTPLGAFIGSLTQLERLSVEFSTTGFKMFDSSMGMSLMLLNLLNSRVLSSFFNLFAPFISELTSLQLPDFFTSFVYYRPDFYESLLHTCRCTGCDTVLRKLKTIFLPIADVEFYDENDPRIDGDSAYYLVGHILAKLQNDREVSIPVKDCKLPYSAYPIYMGQPHMLHHWFHVEEGRTDCLCDVDGDPDGTNPHNIDKLVTTYVVHQLTPVVSYISRKFPLLKRMVIHGIYYERVGHTFEPVFDASEYPEDFTINPPDWDVEFGFFWAED